MNTTFLLMAKYDGLPVIPVDRVVCDFFAPLSVEKFLEYTTNGTIKLPVVRMYGSQKAAKGVNLNDLAKYLDERTEAARKEMKQLAS